MLSMVDCYSIIVSASGVLVDLPANLYLTFPFIISKERVILHRSKESRHIRSFTGSKTNQTIFTFFGFGINQFSPRFSLFMSVLLMIVVFLFGTSSVAASVPVLRQEAMQGYSPMSLSIVGFSMPALFFCCSKNQMGTGYTCRAWN
jgi:hypothetical protein